jgi:DNA-binding MarR family transcriptional regulator
MNDLYQTMFELVKHFNQLTKYCCGCCSEELGFIQYVVLYEIAQKENQSMQDLADKTATDITTFSRQIKKLIQMDLVKKVKCKDDGRIHYVALTEKGKNVKENIQYQMQTYIKEMLGALNENEQNLIQTALPLLTKEVIIMKKACCDIKEQACTCGKECKCGCC